MAHVCEGTVYSKDISKQYLESIKTVKQMPLTSTNRVTVKAGAVEAIVKAGIGPNQKTDLGTIVLIVGPVILLRDARHLERNATIATRRPFFPVLQI